MKMHVVKILCLNFGTIFGGELVPLRVEMGHVKRVRTIGFGDNRDNVAAMLFFR